MKPVVQCSNCFPSLGWHTAQIQDKEFLVWGKTTRASVLCKPTGRHSGTIDVAAQQLHGPLEGHLEHKSMQTLHRKRPVPTIYFVQFQGPPALVHSDGRWHSTSDIFCLSLSTAAYHNIDLVILGPTGNASRNEKAGKGAALRAFLSGVPADSIIFFYDAQDTFVLQDTQTAAEAVRYFDLTETVVLSAERNCWAFSGCRSYPEAPTSYRYVNSGALVATNGPHLSAFVESWARCSALEDDQKCLHYFYTNSSAAGRYRTGNFRLVLDHHCRLFQSGWGSQLEGGPGDRRAVARDGAGPWVVNGTLTNPETNTRPAFLHFNGGKQCMKYYHNQLFPGLTWHTAQIQDKEFLVWGKTTRASALCKPETLQGPVDRHCLEQRRTPVVPGRPARAGGAMGRRSPEDSLPLFPGRPTNDTTPRRRSPAPTYKKGPEPASGTLPPKWRAPPLSKGGRSGWMPSRRPPPCGAPRGGRSGSCMLCTCSRRACCSSPACWRSPAAWRRAKMRFEGLSSRSAPPR